MSAAKGFRLRIRAVRLVHRVYHVALMSRPEV